MFPVEKKRDQSGQAMIEFVIALIGVLAVVAGIITVADLSRADSDTYNAASEDAIGSAMGNPIAANFTPVKDWNKGADGRTFTKDDRPEHGSFAWVRNSITSRTVPNGDWSVTDRADGAQARYADIKDLDAGSNTSALFAFSRGRAETTVETLPIARTLFGVNDIVTVRNEVYMPATGGLY